eukprot:scaffold600_cov193-Ochromonas_danica.AAC.6
MTSVNKSVRRDNLLALSLLAKRFQDILSPYRTKLCSAILAILQDPTILSSLQLPRASSTSTFQAALQALVDLTRTTSSTTSTTSSSKTPLVAAAAPPHNEVVQCLSTWRCASKGTHHAGMDQSATLLSADRLVTLFEDITRVEECYQPLGNILALTQIVHVLQHITTTTSSSSCFMVVSQEEVEKVVLEHFPFLCPSHLSHEREVESLNLDLCQLLLSSSSSCSTTSTSSCSAYLLQRLDSCLSTFTTEGSGSSEEVVAVGVGGRVVTSLLPRVLSLCVSAVESAVVAGGVWKVLFEGVVERLARVFAYLQQEEEVVRGSSGSTGRQIAAVVEASLSSLCALTTHLTRSPPPATTTTTTSSGTSSVVVGSMTIAIARIWSNSLPLLLTWKLSDTLLTRCLETTSHFLLLLLHLSATSEEVQGVVDSVLSSFSSLCGLSPQGSSSRGSSAIWKGSGSASHLALNALACYPATTLSLLLLPLHHLLLHYHRGVEAGAGGVLEHFRSIVSARASELDRQVLLALLREALGMKLPNQQEEEEEDLVAVHAWSVLAVQLVDYHLLSLEDIVQEVCTPLYLLVTTTSSTSTSTSSSSYQVRVARHLLVVLTCLLVNFPRLLPRCSGKVAGGGGGQKKKKVVKEVVATVVTAREMVVAALLLLLRTLPHDDDSSGSGSGTSAHLLPVLHFLQTIYDYHAHSAKVVVAVVQGEEEQVVTIFNEALHRLPVADATLCLQVITTLRYLVLALPTTYPPLIEGVRRWLEVVPEGCVGSGSSSRQDVNLACADLAQALADLSSTATTTSHST